MGQQRTTRFAVMGAGGVGGYFGARLADAGYPVAVIARGDHLRAIRERGIAVRSPSGDVTFEPTIATDDAGAIGPVDTVLFTVKLYDVEQAATAIRPLLGAETMVLALQNGVDAAERIAGIVGKDRVIGGTTYIFTAIDSPGVIRHLGRSPGSCSESWTGARANARIGFSRACRPRASTRICPPTSRPSCGASSSFSRP